MRIDSFFLDYIIAPAMQGALLVLANLGWFGEGSFRTSMLVFFMMLILSYEIGYKRYYVALRHAYFHVIFLLPLVFSSISLVVWFSFGVGYVEH